LTSPLISKYCCTFLRCSMVSARPAWNSSSTVGAFR
jgi:hypothetical protein